MRKISQLEGDQVRVKTICLSLNHELFILCHSDLHIYISELSKGLHDWPGQSHYLATLT